MSKILFVSDSPISSRTLANILGGHYTVDSIKLSEAKVIEDHEIIICDIENDQPTCPGEVTRLRELTGFRDIPILVAVGAQNKTAIRSAGQMGAVGVLLKPFEAAQCSEVLKTAITPVGTKSQINMKVVTPFVDGTVQVIEMMAKEKSSRKSMFLKTNYTMFGDVTGVMGITGETEGVVAVTFHQDLAFHLVAKMVGCDEVDLSVDDVNDGIGEIINMIAGSAKKTLSGTDYEFNISLPTVIMGHGHQIAHQRNVPVIVVVFDCGGFPFAVQLCVSSSADDESKSKSVAQKKQTVSA